MTEFTNFRQRLDTVLRTLDVKQVQDFLIAERQWNPGQPADPEFAMWMMIAGSPSLHDLHEQARQWLINHGHTDDAQAVLGSAKGSSTKQKKGVHHKGKKPGKSR
ncbi:MAG TPA: hypothetical protein VJ761_20910 [Ktedonobacteraceae bacterium]|nr:hypothetical protein [Ktedonobacteraceae bacterium]